MKGPVTSDPLLIALINMTIVFGVLGSLGIMIELIHLVDPTKASKAPAAAPVAAAPAVAEIVEESVEDDSAIIAAITAAVVAMGYSSEQIAYIGRLDQKSWAANSRIEAVSTRNQMFI